MKKKITLIMLVVIICSGLIMISNKFQGTQLENLSTNNKEQSENLIIYDETEKKTILTAKVDLENKTVEEVTQEALKNQEMGYTMLGSGDTVYFTMINGIQERTKGPLSGWCYYINGNKPSISAGAYRLKAEDKVEWKFIKNGLKN
ncbi:DUF4430 domain-containing protein [Clostridium bovifaecis]|uniref:DUF4430 domain-containing protein n=1 Tax=Clostridium bovifaecis TaxID=2184719 RepID=A0A6I6F5F8_9CLOT|nr:DUF4430 domain-containing protein [Clostridium bovifaecis]